APPDLHEPHPPVPLGAEEVERVGRHGAVRVRGGDDVDGPRGLAVAEPDAEVGVGALAEPAGGEGGLGRRVAAGGEGVRLGVADGREGAGAPAYGGGEGFALGGAHRGSSSTWMSS